MRAAPAHSAGPRGKADVARQLAGSGGLTEELRAAAARWAVASARAQGLPEQVSDGRVLRRVALLLSESDTPNRSESTRVETVEAAPRWADNNVVKDSG